jgi:hypothetical protein
MSQLMYFGTQLLTMGWKGGQAIVARLHIHEHMLESGLWTYNEILCHCYK